MELDDLTYMYNRWPSSNAC